MASHQCIRGVSGRGGRGTDAHTRLTPQELQIITLAAAGANKEVAAQLFLSPRTIA